jgi:hypothetical protein
VQWFCEMKPGYTCETALEPGADADADEDE